MPRMWGMIREWWRDLRDPQASNRTVAAATVIIAVATCFTWLEVHSSSKQTDKIVTASQRIQNALETQNRENQRALEETIHQSQEAMDASNAQSRASLDAAIASSQLDQRAWLGVMVGHIVPIDGNLRLRIEIDIVNTGRTPAIHVQQAGSRFIAKKPLLQEPPPSIIRGLVFHPAMTVPPQAKLTISAEESVENLGDDYAAMKSGGKIFYFVGEIRYDDIFGKKHRVRFCFYRAHPEDQVLSACERFNDVN